MIEEKTREGQRNKSHIHIGKDKGRTREGQGKDSEKQNPVLMSGRKQGRIHGYPSRVRDLQIDLK